jgi:hypothetical protein
MKKYSPIYCRIVLNLGRDGASRTQMAGRLKTTPQQLRGWARKYEAFADALERADGLALCYWENKVQDYLCHPPRLARARTRRTRNRLKQQYAEKGKLLLGELTRRFPRQYRVVHVGAPEGMMSPKAVSRVIVRPHI